MEHQHVFISKEGDALIFRLPHRAGDKAGDERVVRVQLYNRMNPHAHLTALERLASGHYRYSYKVCNGEDAKDPIDVFGLVVAPYGRDETLMSHSPSAGVPWNGRVPAIRVMAAQYALDRSLRGRYASWTRGRDAAPIAPGECLDGFSIESPNGPGILTAYVRNYKDPDFGWDDLPREVVAQAMNLDERPWFEKHALTVGPMFPPGTPPAQMAENFRKGISLLIEQGELRQDSPFVAELLRQLETVESHGGGVRIKAAPENEWESAILEAVKLSLGPAR